MSDRLQVAFAVLAGYYLGRRRKLRTAAALAAAGLAGRASCGEGGALGQGIKALGSNVELQQITGRLRGELMEVGKAAALTAASRQIDSLSQRLQARAETLTESGEAEEQTAKKQESSDEDADYDEEDYGEEDYAEEAEEPPPARKRAQPEEKPAHGRPRRARPVRRVSQSRG
ncbi:hypothetical protein [Nonomuraea sp. NPDC048826]|uniref:hypothetical protein n=1 Tax=Nonomuraea sp. NPDC048826 TaxID=3364347 RepID=UPI00371F6B09